MTTWFWRKQLANLREEHRVVAIDPRAYGKSEKVSYGHRLARHAADVRDVMEALDLTDTTLVGWSLAANVLFSYYELFGDARIARMVYIEASPYPKNEPRIPQEQPSWDIGYATVDAEKTFIKNYREDPKSVVGGLVDAMFTGPVSSDIHSKMVREVLQTPAPVAVQIEWEYYNADWRSVVPRVNVPMLVVSGRHSKFYPLEAGKWVADTLPNGHHVVFDNSAHVPFLEEAPQFNSTLRRFTGPS